MKSSKQYIQTFEKLNVTDPTPWEKYLLKILILLGISSLIFLIIWFIRNVEIGQSFFFWFLIFAMGFRVSRILALWYHYFFLDALQPEKLENKKVTVDVFTTYFPGEPKEMVKNTLLAMKNITYPHENFLCDEANDEELILFCKNYQIHHITRNNRTNAKAGNVNNALKHAKGEFCFILDPDHVPHPDLLNIVIPHFNKPEIGFVQVVQGYYNIENSLIAKAAAQQTYQFYGPMMMGMNSLGTVQAIGANCCFRRKALDSIGGHAAGLAEDLHTSMLLHANGWKSVYIPQVVTKGLVPEDFHGYFKQQLKWSKGSFDLLFQVFPKICNKLTFQQKIHYLFQPQYYFFGLMTFIEILIPIISLLFIDVPWKIDIVAFLLISSPFILFATLIHIYVQNWVLEEDERGFHLLGGLIRNATWFIFLIGLVSSVFKINIKYLPTPKENYSGGQIIYVIPNLIIAILSLLAIIYGLNYDYTPYSLFMAGFAMMNFLMFSISSLLAFPIFNLRIIDTESKEISLLLIRFVKVQLWYLRHFLYGVARKQIILVSVLMILLLILFPFFKKITTPPLLKNKLESDTFLIGTNQNNKPSNIKTVTLYLDCDSIINQISRIENDTTSFLYLAISKSHASENNLEMILEGQFDEQLNLLAKKIKELQHHVYITIETGGNTELKKNIFKKNELAFKKKKAWYHIIDTFEQQKCYNSIWVFPLSVQDNLKVDVPNSQNWDWGLLNLAEIDPSGIDRLVESGIEFVRKPLILDFSQSMVEKVTPNTLKSIVNTFNILGCIDCDEVTINALNIRNKWRRHPIQYSDAYIKLSKNTKYELIKGVCYDPFDVQSQNKVVLNRNQLNSDFSKISSMGANFIRIYNKDIYLRNIIKSASVHNLAVMAGIHFPGTIDYYADEAEVKKLHKKVIDEVKQFAGNKQIKFWNFGDDVFGHIQENFAKPYSDLVMLGYIKFLSTLVNLAIEIDPETSYVFSVPFTYRNYEFLVKNQKFIHPNLTIGLNVFYEDHFQYIARQSNRDTLHSQMMITAFGPEGFWDQRLTRRTHFNLAIEPSDFEKAKSYSEKWNKYLVNSHLLYRGGFAYRWKEHPVTELTWMGITTILDTKKQSFNSLKNVWNDEVPIFFKDEHYNIAYNGHRVVQRISRPVFHLTRDFEFIDPSAKLDIKWYLRKHADYDFFTYIGNTPSVNVDFDLQNGDYSMHLYITDSLKNSTSFSVPFVVY